MTIASTRVHLSRTQEARKNSNKVELQSGGLSGQSEIQVSTTKLLLGKRGSWVGPWWKVKRLHSLKVARGLSRDQLAERSGITMPVVRAIENLGREPRLGTLVALVMALEMTVSELIGGVE